MLTLVGLVGIPSGLRAETTAASLPLDLADPWHTLDERLDTGLQEKLLRELERRELWKALIRKKKMAVGLVDLRDPGLPRFAMVNGKRTMYAASLPKIAVMYSSFKGFERGSLMESPEAIKDLQAMIRSSSNDAATRLIQELGFERIASELTSPTVELYDGRAGQLGGAVPPPVRTQSRGEAGTTRA